MRLYNTRGGASHVVPQGRSSEPSSSPGKLSKKGVCFIFQAGSFPPVCPCRYPAPAGIFGVLSTGFGVAALLELLSVSLFDWQGKQHGQPPQGFFLHTATENWKSSAALVKEAVKCCCCWRSSLLQGTER